MKHSLLGQKLVIASHNSGKISEIIALLSSFEINIVSAKDLHLTEPIENGKTFYENALIKAKTASKESGLIGLADDSGLCIHALNNRPGIFSARWAGPNKDFKIAIKKVQTKLQDETVYSAHFICGLSLFWPDGFSEYFEGRVDGNIQFPPIGNNGFGYDPIFCPDGSKMTFAQLSEKEKNQITHRAKAFKQLSKAYLK